MLLAIISLASISKVVTFLLMLSVLVMLHEYGHFIVARRNGVRVNEYAIGMGPKIFGWTSKRSGTLYSVRALPIGGYCAMEGEDNKTSQAEQQRDFLASDPQIDESDNFQAKKPWQRLLIVLAGPVANFILCYGLLLVSALVFGVSSDNSPETVVGMVQPGMPAAKAGIHVGDRIVSVNGAAMANGNTLIDVLHQSRGKLLRLGVVRGGDTREFDITPVACPPAVTQKIANAGCIGIQPFQAYERVGFMDAVKDSGYAFVNIAENTVGSLVLLVTHFSQYASQVSGPIGMGQAAGVVQDIGWGPYLGLAAMISFALGVFNLLPVPALDGGRAAFIIVEMLRGKPVDRDREAMVHIAGFAALMALMVIIAFHDIARIVSGQGVF